MAAANILLLETARTRRRMILAALRPLFNDTQLGGDPLPGGASTGFGMAAQLGTSMELGRRPQAAGVSGTGTKTTSGNAYHLAAASERSDAEAVFSAVLTAIVTRIEPKIRQELREYMEVTIGSLGLASEVLPAMRAWCVRLADHPEPVEVELSPGDMRSVVHHLYCWCCELNGPIGADKLFNTAMQLVQRMPQARSMDPRTLL